MLLSQFFIYLLFALVYLFIDWHIHPLIPASIINNISISVNNSKFANVFFKHACHANPGADKKREGSSPYISIYFQKHLQAIMYHTEHTSHDTHQDYLFQILPILFEHANSLYQ